MEGLRRLGLLPGQVVMLHASVSAIGWVEIEYIDTTRGALEWEGGNYFEAIAREYLAPGKGHMGKVGAAESYLFDAADLIRSAIK
ncbi:MAG: hypothetical protein NUW06_05010 [Candidatus Acetothermia bacterium]|nr:hypothetical protein [Candidatus Acetothermia bacterium]MDH7505179.1 hypothetical protein [Candidatus Acetothermia bacterium]